jgi:hypothetical protein
MGIYSNREYLYWLKYLNYTLGKYLYKYIYIILDKPLYLVLTKIIF